MTDPPGAGQSVTVVSTCVRKIKEAGSFGASFFFYRPNGWNDAQEFILFNVYPTVYQLTTRYYPAYRDCMDCGISRPTRASGANRHPSPRVLQQTLAEPECRRPACWKRHIVVESCDECATVNAHVQITDFITFSIPEWATLFLWASLGLPEPLITPAFSFAIAMNNSWTPSLSLSGNTNSHIEACLHGNSKVIRGKQSIPASGAWFVEEYIRRLVFQSTGLFVYSVTATRYIDGLTKRNSELEEWLCAAL